MSAGAVAGAGGRGACIAWDSGSSALHGFVPCMMSAAEKRDAACPISTKEGGGSGAAEKRDAIQGRDHERCREARRDLRDATMGAARGEQRGGGEDYEQDE